MSDAPVRTPKQRLLGASCRGFTLAGWVVPIALVLAGTRFEASELLLAGVLLAIGVVSGRLEIEFRIAGREIFVVPDGVAWVIAAIVLDPTLAMLVALASVMPSLGNGVRRELANGGALASTVGLVSLLVHVIAPSPSVDAMLLVGLAAAIAFDVILVTEGVAFLESRELGAAKEHLGDSWLVAGFEVALPTLAVGVVAPFVDTPLLAGAVLAGYQAITYAGLSVLKREQVFRARSNYLGAAFARYVPASVAEQLTEEEAAITLGGELVEVTVMFLDVRGFTSLSERLAPAEVVEQLNGVLGACTEAVFATGGTLDKFTGDGLMAFWGAPVRSEDDPARACRCALDMLERTRALNDVRPDGQPHLHIGIGIHTGRALVGNIGHADRLDYTAIGDTVNVAARLEAKTKDARCDALISGATFERLVGTEEFDGLESAGDLHVKGRVDAVEAYVLARDEHGIHATGAAADAA